VNPEKKKKIRKATIPGLKLKTAKNKSAQKHNFTHFYIVMI
jgi:hypothetical protein